jgi:hypothetical protein
VGGKNFETSRSLTVEYPGTPETKIFGILCGGPFGYDHMPPTLVLPEQVLSRTI